MNILIVPDKFKGTLSSQQAAAAIGRGWASTRPADKVHLLPMSDGGDGFGEVISRLVGAQPQPIKTVDAAHRPIDAAWWWVESSKTAIIESAQVIGLALLPRGKYHPFELDTLGLGAVVKAAKQKGARTCLIGIGGSATNDGGFGLACALGWQFFTHRGDKIQRWTELHTLDRIRAPENIEWPEEITVAVDVQNTLLGPQGCTRVYGPQKGLKPEDFEFAERCLGQLANCASRYADRNDPAAPGSGAAGGLGYGLVCFANARLDPGFRLFADHAQLEQQIRESNLVVTAEGAIDSSTLMGKGVGEIARLCRQRNVPCIGLAGVLENPEEAAKLFTAVYAMSPSLASAEEAKREPAKWLELLAAKAAGEISAN